MSDPRRDLNEIDADLRASPKQVVLYLEGRTDEPLLCALLGISPPTIKIGRGFLHQNVLVKGLDGGKGSGSLRVRALTERAKNENRAHVYGVCDGDGDQLSALAACFDLPFAGPLFRWRAYCAENLLALTAWPSAWGPPPDWQDVFDRYLPYAALNALHVELRGRLETLKLDRFTSPNNQQIYTAQEILDRLNQDKHLIQGVDVAQRFDEYIQGFRARAAADIREIHTIINGKWLLHFARHSVPGLQNQDEDAARTQWAEAARAAGGLQEVKDWWDRVTTSP